MWWTLKTHRWGLMVLWSFQFDTNVCPLPSLKFTKTWSINVLKVSFMRAWIQLVDVCGCSKNDACKCHMCLTWGVATAGGAGAAAAVLQPRAVGEGVSLVWRPGRRQTLLGTDTEERLLDTRLSAVRMRLGLGECAHHAGVIVLCGLRLVLLHHTGQAAVIGGGAGEVLTFRDGWGPAAEIRTTPWVNTLQHSQTCCCLLLSVRIVQYLHKGSMRDFMQYSSNLTTGHTCS